MPARCFRSPNCPAPRRALPALALSLAASLMLAACGGGSTDEPAPASTTLSPAPVLSVSAAAPRMTIQAAATTAGTIDTSGIDTLFKQISSAFASAAACAGPGGMAAAMATQAHLDTPSTSFKGAAPVAAALCAWAADDRLWGATLNPATPTRCSQREGVASCRVNVDLLASDGTTRRLGRQLAVTRESSGWKLLGHVDPLNINAFASAQRERRLDSGITVDRYQRGLVLAIPAARGLACARVTQTDAGGQRSTLAFFKPYDGLGVQRLSLWRTSASADAPRSMTASNGDLRIVDDVYLALPDGSAGDAIVNNLVRDSGSVRVALFADAGCSTPWAGAAGGATSNEFDVTVDGLPPLTATLAAQPWPQLTGAAALDLRRLGLNSLASATLKSAWTGTAAGFRPESAMLCVDDAHCAEGDNGRIGERALARNASVTTLTLKNRRDPVVPADFKLMSLTGRNSAGLVMLADFHTCASTTAGQPCPKGL